jgi:uncharacterized protein YkwD
MAAAGQSYTERNQRLLAKPPSSISVPGAAEDRVFSLLNKLRADKGLPMLRPGGGLRDAARVQSYRMLRDDYFSHQDPDGGNVAERLAAVDRQTLYSAIGENLAKISPPGQDPARTVHDGWVASPGHYKNMIADRFTHVGIGCAVQKRILVCTQVFGKTTGRLLSALPARPGQSGRTDVSASIQGLNYGGWVLLDRQGTERAKGHGAMLKWPSGLRGEYQVRVIGKAQQGNRIYLHRFFGPSVVLD